MRVAQSRRLVAEGFPAATVARTAQISRQALYRKPCTAPPKATRKPTSEIERRIIAVAKANDTDGYPMITEFTARELGIPVNRKRVLRVMRKHRLIQRRQRLDRRRRPGKFTVERPNQLWHMDMSAIWVAEHGWCYLFAAIDCCTRKITAWGLELRCRAQESAAVVIDAAASNNIGPGTLTLGTDNGSCFTARSFRNQLAALGITHRRGGYRDPESQAFIESWFGKLKRREVWRAEYETLEDARRGIGSYIDRYHDRPHQGLGYRTPNEVAEAWRLQTDAA